MTKKPYILEKYESKDFEFRWRLRVRRGGRIIADSGEGYLTKYNLTRAVNRLPFDWNKIEVTWLPKELGLAGRQKR